MNFNEFLEKEALFFKDKVIFNKEVLFQDENQSQHLLSLQTVSYTHLTLPTKA